MTHCLDIDKGKPEVDADWYAEAQELLAPYVRAVWENYSPRTAKLAYKEFDMPQPVKFVKR